MEQIADASGIAVGGSVVRMSRDLSRLKVLMPGSAQAALSSASSELGLF